MEGEGIKVYGVMVDGGKEAWLQFIKDHNLTDWIHVYETKEHQDATEKAGQPGYRQLYDVYETPILYLLDKDKRIIAKKLDLSAIDEVINLKMRKKNPIEMSIPVKKLLVDPHSFSFPLPLSGVMLKLFLPSTARVSARRNS
jgi:hypothetical protein